MSSSPSTHRSTPSSSSSSVPPRQLHSQKHPQQTTHLSLPSAHSSRNLIDSSGNVLLLSSPSLIDASASSPSAASTSFSTDRPVVNGHGIGRSSSPSYAASSLRHPDDNIIEMDPITPGGHRRRRSTLTGAGSVPPISSRITRPRGNSIKAGPSEAAPKISEEANSSELARPDHHANLHSDAYVSDEDLHDDEETGLTNKDKRRKRAKKRRNTRLDQRVARDNLSEEQKREADLHVARRLAINLCLIGLWYIFSLSISLVSQEPSDAARYDISWHWSR